MTQKKTRVPRCTRACSEMHTFEPGCTEYHDPQLEVNYESHRDYELKKRHKERIDKVLEPQVADDIPLTLHLPVDISPQARFIIEEILPDAINLFVRKNKDYTVNGRNISENFGVQGQFMKMHDKVAKLWKPLWDGERTMEGEQPEEILQDMLAHVLLTLYFLQTEENVEI